VKSLELAAERLQNRLLAECLPLEPRPKAAVGRKNLRSVLEIVVTLFVERRENGSIAGLLSPIDLIVDAAMQGAN